MDKEVTGSAGRFGMASWLKLCFAAALLLFVGLASALWLAPRWGLWATGGNPNSAPWERRPGLENIVSFDASHFEAFRPSKGNPVVATSLDVRDVLGEKVLYKLPHWDEWNRWIFAAFSPDGKLLATAAQVERKSPTDPRFELRLHDAATGKSLTLLHRGAKDSWGGIVFSPDGQFLAESCGSDIFLWDVRNRKEVHRLHHERGFVDALAYHPDGKLLVSMAGQLLHFWDVEKGNLGHTLTAGKDCTFQGLAISPDGKLLATAKARSSTEQGLNGNQIHSAIHLFELPSRKELAAFPEQKGPILRLAFRGNNRWLASTCGEPQVLVFDIPNRKLLYTLPLDNEGTGVAFSSDDRWLATADGKHVKLWDLIPAGQ